MAMDASADAPKDCHMRAFDDSRTNEPAAPHAAVQRNLQAAHLLQEALALLCGESPQQIAQATTRAHDRLLRLPDVERLTGLRRSAIYEQMQRGVFPRSVKVGKRAATWSESAVQSWIADRLDGRTS
jgi:prophage regulatory protein